jgi:hypothetical protein
MTAKQNEAPAAANGEGITSDTSETHVEPIIGTNGEECRAIESKEPAPHALRSWYGRVIHTVQQGATWPLSDGSRASVSLPVDCIIETWEPGEVKGCTHLGFSDRLTLRGDRAFIADLIEDGHTEEELRALGLWNDTEGNDDELKFAYSIEVERDGIFLIRPRDHEEFWSLVVPKKLLPAPGAAPVALDATDWAADEVREIQAAQVIRDENGQAIQIVPGVLPAPGPYLVLFPFRGGLGVVASRDFPLGLDGLPQVYELNFRPASWGEPRMLIQPRLDVCGWNGGDDTPVTRLKSMPPSLALTRKFGCDAFTAQYYSPQRPYRINNKGQESISPYEGAKLVWVMFDVDGEGHKATEEWRAEEERKVARLQEVYPGAFNYNTRNGYRIVYRLPYPRRPENWRAFYRASLDHLRDEFGIVADDALSIWNQPVRLPWVRRKGDRAPVVRPTSGDPANIGFWTFDPNLSAAPPETKSRKPQSKRGPTVNKPPASLAELPDELARHVPAFAAAFKEVEAVWHRVHLVLATALSGRMEVKAIPAFLRAVAGAAGDCHAEERFATAISSLERQAEGIAVRGYPTLVCDYPPIVRVLDKLFPRATDPIAELRRRIENAVLPETVEREHAAEEIAVGIRRFTPIIKSTTGAGKTVAVVRVAVERARKGLRTVIVAPTHKMAHQVIAEIEARGVDVLYVRGPLSVEDETGAPVCEFAGITLPQRDVGANIRWEFCKGQGKQPCPYLETCPAAKGEEGEKGAPVVVGVHAMLPTLAKKVGENGLLIIDETPTLKETFIFTKGDIATTIQVLEGRRAFGQELSDALLPAVRRFAAGEVLSDEERAALEKSLGASSDGFDPMPHILTTEIVGLRSTRDRERAQNVATARRVLTAMARLYVKMRGPLYAGSFQEGVRGINPEVAEVFRRKGQVVLLDATPDLRLLEHVMGHAPERTELNVGNGATIRREVVYTKATRSSLTPDGGVNVREVAKILEQALAGAEGQFVGIVTYKEIAGPLREAWESAQGPFAELLNAHRATGGELDVLHYGNMRGRDDLKEVDRLVTIGDPCPNVGNEEAWAKTLNIEDADGYINQLTRDELEQAHGRIRAPWRTKPAVAMHFGRELPGGWGAGTTVSQMPTGRPKNTAAMAGEEFKGARVGLKLSQKEFAKLMELSERAVRNYESGARGIPPDVAAEVRGLSDRHETPYKDLSSIGGFVPVAPALSTPPGANTLATTASYATIEGVDVPAAVEETKEPAQVLLDTLRTMGCAVTRQGDRFTVSPAAALDDDLRAAVWGYRWEILGLLEEREAA